MTLPSIPRHRTFAFGLAVCLLAVPVGLSGCGGMKMGGGVPAFERAEQPCKDSSFPIYFDKGSDQLTADARQLVNAMGSRMKACKVKGAEVVGLADAGGPAERSVELSRRRADSVAKALAEAGLPAPKMDIEASGASGALTPAGRPEPLRRRTEVILHVVPA